MCPRACGRRGCCQPAVRQAECAFYERTLQLRALRVRDDARAFELVPGVHIGVRVDEGGGGGGGEVVLTSNDVAGWVSFIEVSAAARSTAAVVVCGRCAPIQPAQHSAWHKRAAPVATRRVWQAASADGASSVRIIARAADSAAFTDPAGHVLRIIAPIATASSNSELDAFRARCAPLSRTCRARKRMRG
jgi:hypothetical protein